MIYDCFQFFNELDLLEIRLHELSNVVDKFVLVEATKTHAGRPKPLYYKENRKRFEEFYSRILHIVVENMPITNLEIQACLSGQDRHWIESKYQVEDSWVRERYQRNAIMRGLVDASPEDIIIISDADEIVKASKLVGIEDTLCAGSNAVEQTLNTYYVNWQCTNMPWWGSKIIRKKYLVGETTPSEVRFHTPAQCYIRDGGWHFNFLGGADSIRQKLRAYAHQEFNTSEVLNLVEGRLANQKDVLGRLYEYKTVPLDERFPKYLLENQDKFSHLIYKG